jgi:hypothetical protein
VFSNEQPQNGTAEKENIDIVNNLPLATASNQYFLLYYEYKLPKIAEK